MVVNTIILRPTPAHNPIRSVSVRLGPNEQTARPKARPHLLFFVRLAFGPPHFKPVPGLHPQERQTDGHALARHPPRGRVAAIHLPPPSKFNAHEWRAPVVIHMGGGVVVLLNVEVVDRPVHSFHFLASLPPQALTRASKP